MPEKPIIICTRGSALALAQSNLIAAECRRIFPRLRFELKIIKTIGDKLQKTALTTPNGGLPKGLFTKELEIALVKKQADIAVHSLKDLPTELPAGLVLAATPKRADVRDVLIYRDADYFADPANHQKEEWTPGQSALVGLQPHTKLKDFPKGATIATSSTRRRAQLLAARPDLKIVEIRGNVTTRLQKVADRAELDATVLALAGISRLNFTISPDGKLHGDAVPDGLLAIVLETDVMLPAVGQGAIGVEIRADDERIIKICERLNHFNTFQCVAAERAFLAGMGGGCQSPVAAHAEVVGEQLRMKAISFADGSMRKAEAKRPVKEAAELGEQLAVELNPCTTTTDKNGIPYHEKLKRLRQQSGKPIADIAWALGMTCIDYEEIENHASELARGVSLDEICKLASVLGISAHDIFDHPIPGGNRISPEQLSARIKSHLAATGSDIDSFENRVGFEIRDILSNPSKMMDWNVDCLRFVCAEIGVDWLSALATG